MTDLMTSPFALPLLTAIAMFVAIWPISVRRQDASLVDLAWGPGFFVQLVVALYASGPVSAHGWLLLGLVGVWSARLSIVLARRRFREGHEDPRYTIVRKSWGPGFWWKSLFLVFVLQAFLQWLIILGPIAGGLAEPDRINWMAGMGIALALTGIGLETWADLELDRFKRTAASTDLLQTGLRAHVRHPNYVGEIIFWSGVALVVSDAGSFAGFASPLLLTLFLTKISGAPLLDERLSETRPAYPAYRARVPGFLPRLGRGANQ